MDPSSLKVSSGVPWKNFLLLLQIVNYKSKVIQLTIPLKVLSNEKKGGSCLASIDRYGLAYISTIFQALFLGPFLKKTSLSVHPIIVTVGIVQKSANLQFALQYDTDSVRPQSAIGIVADC